MILDLVKKIIIFINYSLQIWGAMNKSISMGQESTFKTENSYTELKSPWAGFIVIT